MIIVPEEGRSQNRRIEVIPEVTGVIPDSTGKPEEVFNQFILRGDDAFESNTATLKELVKILLNGIAGTLKASPEANGELKDILIIKAPHLFLKSFHWREQTLFMIT